MSERTSRRALILGGSVVSVSLMLVGGCANDAAPVANSGSAAVVMAARAPARQPGQIDYIEETLPNGLRVIYAPMTNAPVAHIRLVYNVGSRDERPDRQGFAHLFEHMMFRGSAHVAPEQHMRLVDHAGGSINAFTSTDQTCYYQTVPSSHLEPVLWLEADRMASFKVSDEIFQTERKVVAEEWRLNYANRPDGTLLQDFYKLAFKEHSYRWTTIGDMDQLRQASSAELQEFFNKYYVPNNACLVIAGDIDVAKTAYLVRKFYGWIPRGKKIERNIPVEPVQTAERKQVVYKKLVPVATLWLGWKTVEYKDVEEQVALDAAAAILGGSPRTSRLGKVLVNPEGGGKPQALQAGANHRTLQDLSMLTASASVFPGNDPEQVEKQIKAVVAEFVANGPTADELARFKTATRVAMLGRRETAEDLATVLGESEVFGGDASLANRELALTDALTPERVRAAAAKFLKPEAVTIVHYLPDPTGEKAREQAAAGGGGGLASADASKADEAAKAGVVQSTTKVEPKPAPFPASYPKAPPAATLAGAKSNLGIVGEVNGVKVYTLQDSRLPLASFQMVLRTGDDAEPENKIGLAGMTAAMLSRGTKGYDAAALAQAFQANGVSVGVNAGGESTTVSGGGTSDKLEYAVEMAALMISEPTFPQTEFDRMKAQQVQGLRRSLIQGPQVAQRELRERMWAGTQFGRNTTAENIQGISLDDVKDWYGKTFKRGGAFVVFTGDVTPEKALALAGKLTANLPAGEPVKASYSVSMEPLKRKLILIDNPDAKQSNILIGYRGFTNKSDDRFAADVARQVLSGGLDARFNKYLRVERGLTYGAGGAFRAGRHNGAFTCSTNTNPATTGASVEGLLKVIESVRTAEITDAELAAAKSSTVGESVLSTQTISAAAAQRVSTILNDWPADYYNQLPARIAAVTKADVLKIMQTYTNPDNAVIVVVGPAATVKEQLTSFGEVEVIPMPLQRKAGAPSAGAQ